MRRERKWLQRLMPVLALAFLFGAQSAVAQDDYNDNNYDNNGNNYDNNDEALIQPEGDVDYNTFHDELSPYGRWMDYPGYGNVWVCNVAGFRPYYSGGHWAYTRFGWTWVSDYNWGWAPFHYGRWSYDNAYGWFWVPGYTWGPAWVSWRNGGDYYGWAPLSPGLSIGINVGVGIPYNNWVFLPHRYMGYRSLNHYYVPPQRNVTIIRNTTIINNTNVYNNNRYVVGPNRSEVERYSGQRIQQQNIYVSNNRNVSRDDRNGVHLYVPNANQNAGNRRVYNGNNPQVNRGAQDNIRQQPVERRNMQNGIQQQPNNAATDNNRIDRFQQRREQRVERRDQTNPITDNDHNNTFQNNPQRQQQMQDARDRMQQQRQQPEQQGQPQDNQRQQQLNQQRQQQMNDRREQMQQQMNQRRQEQDAQRQQQQMQQKRQQQEMQRQQQMQQRQQQMQQRNESLNRPAPQQQNGGGRRRNT